MPPRRHGLLSSSLYSYAARRPQHRRAPSVHLSRGNKIFRPATTAWGTNLVKIWGRWAARSKNFENLSLIGRRQRPEVELLRCPVGANCSHSVKKLRKITANAIKLKKIVKLFQSYRVLKYNFQVLGLGFGLEGQVLGPGLEDKSLALALKVKSLALALS